MGERQGEREAAVTAMTREAGVQVSTTSSTTTTSRLPGRYQRVK